MKRLIATSFSLLAVAVLAVSAQAAEWGTLKGQFIYDGKAPAPAKLSITKDAQVCGKHNLVDESLLVGPNGGIKNVVVYIRPARGKKIDVHPDYAKTAHAKVVLDNANCRFDPHVALLRTSQTLVVKNSDPVGHNAKIDCFVNSAKNVLIPGNSQVELELKSEERLPVRVSCNIHPWMSAYLIVRDDPYMAVSAEDGTFEIKNIPAGEHEFQFWHEKAGYLGSLEVGKEETNRRGRADLEIESGVTDLGKIKVDPDAFEE
jgi:hypothetical protein